MFLSACIDTEQPWLEYDVNSNDFLLTQEITKSHQNRHYLFVFLKSNFFYSHHSFFTLSFEQGQNIIINTNTQLELESAFIYFFYIFE